LPLSLPWIVSLFFLGRHFGSKNAVKMFALDATSARLLATKSTSASLICCLPFALLMPFWCGMNFILYFVLAVGVQYFSITLSLPAEDNAKKWRWAWASNAPTVAISTLFFVATLACVWVYKYQTRELVPPRHFSDGLNLRGHQIGVGGTRRRFLAHGSITHSDGTRSELTDWYTVPAWYAGKWRVDARRMTKATGGDWKETGAMKDVEYFVGQYADKTGQIWQHRGRAGFAHYDYFPFCGSYEGKEYYFNTRKGVALNQIKHEKFAANDLPGLQSEGVDELFSGAGDTRIKVTSDDSFEETALITTSDTKKVGVVYTHEYWAKAKRIAPFKARINLETPDGKPLYPDFVEFLKEYGMSDRIPPEL